MQVDCGEASLRRAVRKGWTRLSAGASILVARERHMGDEELNFTEEEARSWADDPRNQAPKSQRQRYTISSDVIDFDR